MSEGDWKSRGCIFCKSGKERAVVRQFEKSFPGSRAIAPTKSRYRRTKDAAIEDREILLPGYVFFEVNGSPDENDLLNVLQSLSRLEDVLKLLRYTDGDWRFHGPDDLFAEMLFRLGGNIDVSQAYFDEGDRIRIQRGFLKDYEGCITRVNRKTRSVEVHMDFHDKNVVMWLGYELVTKVASPKASDGASDEITA